MTQEVPLPEMIVVPVGTFVPTTTCPMAIVPPTEATVRFGLPEEAVPSAFAPEMPAGLTNEQQYQTGLAALHAAIACAGVSPMAVTLTCAPEPEPPVVATPLAMA